jgi:hypothetical protein
MEGAESASGSPYGRGGRGRLDLFGFRDTQTSLARVTFSTFPLTNT